ncbi:hypothetical protein CR513_41600, partial [Mucuna pruriens]
MILYALYASPRVNWAAELGLVGRDLPYPPKGFLVFPIKILVVTLVIPVSSSKGTQVPSIQAIVDVITGWVVTSIQRKNNNKKESMKSKKIMMASKRVVRKVLLAKKEPLYLLPTNMCFHLSAQFPNLPTDVGELPRNFPKDIPCGLLPIKGIKHHIDFTMGATFPNRATYRSNLEESKEIQQQVGKHMEKGWAWESNSPCVVLVILVPKKDSAIERTQRLWMLSMDDGLRLHVKPSKGPMKPLDEGCPLDDLYGRRIWTLSPMDTSSL